MPLITTSHRFAPRAGRRPPNELNTNFGLTFHRFAIAPAMSMSKPTTLPAFVLDSIGGEVGLSPYLKETLTREVTQGVAPAVSPPARAAAKATRESRTTERS